MGALGYGLTQLRALGDDLAIVEGGYLPLAKTATRLDSFQTRIDLDLERLAKEGSQPVSRVSTATALYSERILSTVNQGLAIIDTALPSSSQVEETATLTSLKGQLQIIGAAHEDFGRVALGYLDLLETGQADLAEGLEAELLSVQAELDTEISQFATRVDESIQRVYNRTTAAGRRALLVTATLALVALIFGVAMLGIAVVSLRPIGRLTAEVQRIAGGDYDVRIQVNRRDELGILAEETNAMARAIQQQDETLRSRALELDAARNHLRNILDSIRLGLVVVEGELVAMANPAAEEMWKLREGEPLPSFLGSRDDSSSPLERGGRIFEMQRVPFGGVEIIVG
jgi:HAMP domain-containing protein